MWDRFGANVANYVEPFAGSLAVLLARPAAPRVETVNDLDCYLANFWRALKTDPAGVIEWAAGPVNEADLHARHFWLVNQAEFRERMKTDPEYCDARIAGWWVWGISQWIGSGWCSNPEWRGRTNAGRADKGIHRRALGRPKRKIPNVGRGGLRGVLRPGLQDDEPEDDMQPETGAAVEEWLQALAHRLTRVRVCCGDWRRVLTRSPTTLIGTTAVFLDPPYAIEERESVYREESFTIAHAVREWAIENGPNPDFRIALCGYDDNQMPEGWKAVAWKAKGGYGNQAAPLSRGRLNKDRETIWFSPGCLEPQGDLFNA